MADILTALNKNGSGLNIRDLATSLVNAEIVPRRSAEEKRIDKADLSLSAIGRVRAQMQQVSTAMQAIGQTPILKATSSSSAVQVTIRDATKITNSTRSIGVVQTAQRQVMEFTGFTAADAVLGAGRLTVDTGVWTEDPVTKAQSFVLRPDGVAQSLTLADGATLSDLATALDSLPGVGARVLDKGDGTFSLGVVSEPGAASSLRFSVSGATGPLTGFDTQSGAARVEVAAARDAALRVDGILVMRPTNTIDDLIPGARIEVTGTTGTDATVSFNRDTETAFGNLSFLVETLNTTRALLSEVAARGLNGAEPGALAGDRTVEALRTELDRLASQPLRGFAQSVRLSDFGVQTQRDGSLKLNRSAFDTAFARDPARIEMLFNDSLVSDTAGVTVRGTPTRDAVAGSYAFAREASGRATLDGTALLGTAMGDGTSRYVVLSGGFAGTMLTVPDGVNSANLRYGQGLRSALDELATRATEMAGTLDKRESLLSGTRTEAETRIAALETRAADLEKRYLSRFAAMEQAITSLKGTGQYLTNLVAQWNKDS